MMKKIKHFMLFCAMALISCFVFLICERNHYNLLSQEDLLKIREKLAVLNPQEKEDLTFLMNQTILFDQYGYTLIGYKPMSVCNFLDDSLRGEKLKRGYLVWEKYQFLFSHPNHTLIEYPLGENGEREIALICPHLCRLEIEKNLDDFFIVLGSSYEKEEIFEILTHPAHRDFCKIIKQDRLIGILLGFGENNACLFERYRNTALSGKWEKLALDPLEGFTNEWPIWPRKWRLPSFVCDPSTQETKQLKEHYRKGRKIIRWTYFFRDQFEVTLALLAKDN
jgi:hypothetical protein